MAYDQTTETILKQIEHRESEEKKFSIAWYDPNLRGYRLYTPSGEEIPGQYEGTLNIIDNWGKPFPDSFHRATISFLVRVVNENPEKK